MSKQASTAHPPIPPGCERFICERDGRLEAALVFPLDFNAHPATERFNPHQRAIVAAYCEVAWLKEAERIGLGYDVALQASNQKLMGGLLAERADALANARAWREWGAQ